MLNTIQGATAHPTHVDAQLSSGNGVLLQVVGSIKYRDVSLGPLAPLRLLLRAGIVQTLASRPGAAAARQPAMAARCIAGR